MQAWRAVIVTICLGGAATVAACSKRSEEPLSKSVSAPAAPTTATPHPPAAAPEPAQAKALTWTDPPSWQKETPSNGFRAAQYRVPRASGDSEDALCVVSTFGGGEGGSVDQNVDRWVRQFDPSGSTSPIDKSTETVSGMKVTVVKVSGAYKGMAMPGAPAGPAKTNQRLVGAIVESPSGLWFFKLTGPEATAKAAEPAFAAMIKSLRTASVSER